MVKEESEVLLAAKIWAAAAWADGVIAEEEAQSMKMVIDIAKLSDDEKKTALGWLENKVELEDVDVSGISQDSRVNIYSATLGVITVDNEVADKERKFLERLRKTLDIDEVLAAELEDSAGI